MAILDAVNASRLATALIVLTSGSGALAQSKPVKLENLPYSKARVVILSYGWKPVKGVCAEAASDEPETCAKFPEIDRCLSSYPNMCIMGFKKDQRSLVIRTRYGPPSPGGDGDTTVWTVDFSGKNAGNDAGNNGRRVGRR